MWTYFRLPEPKNRTYGELDILFERGIPARKFAETDVSPWAGGEDVVGMVDSDEKNGHGGASGEHVEKA